MEHADSILARPLDAPRLLVRAREFIVNCSFGPRSTPMAF
jgi:hypothetical protein